MMNNSNDKDIKAAIPAPCDYSNDLEMDNDSSKNTSHVQTASYPSANAPSQLPLQTDGSFQRTELKDQSLHNRKDRTVERPTPTAHLSIDKRQQNKPHQHVVAEQGMDDPVMAHPRTREKRVKNSHVQWDIDRRTIEQLLEDLERTKFDLSEKEGQVNDMKIQVSDLASKNQQWNYHLEQVQTIHTTKEQELKDITNKLSANAIQKEREVEEFRQLWKQAAKELGKYQAQDKVADQVTDSEVTQKARQLQYNIRNFAYQHFGGELSTGKGVQASKLELQKDLQMPIDRFKACIKSPVKRPMLVDALLWVFLLHYIYGSFWWAGSKAHSGMLNLTEILSERSHLACSLNDSNNFHQGPPEAITWPSGPRQNVDIRCGKPILAPSCWMRRSLTEKGRISAEGLKIEPKISVHSLPRSPNRNPRV